jgi:hypothetical protein
MAERTKKELMPLFRAVPSGTFTSGELRHLPSQNLELYRKLSYERTAQGKSGFYDASGNFDLRSAMLEAQNRNLIQIREGITRKGKAFRINDALMPIMEEGLEFIGEDEKSMKEFERTRKQQASTALFAAGNVSDAKGSGAFSLTAESAGAIRRDTQLGLGGSGRGKIVLG